MLPALALGLIAACLVGEAAVLRVGIDDLDEGYFVQQATRVLHGQVPYRDFQTLYTPGLIGAHAVLFWALGGPYVLAPRALALVARAGLAVALYGLARPLVRRPVWAAAPSLFLLIGLDDAPSRWEPHPGWLSTFFAVLAAWCLGVRPKRPGRPSASELGSTDWQPGAGWLIGSGLAAGMSYLFKQNTGAFILAAIVVRGAWQGRNSREFGERWRNVMLPLAAFAAFTLVWLAPMLMILHIPAASLAGFVGAVNQAGLGAPPEPSIAVPLVCGVGGVWLVGWCRVDARVRWYLLAGAALVATQYPRMDTLHLAWSAPLLLVVGAVALDRVPSQAASLVAVLGALVLTAPVITSRAELLQQPLVPISAVRFARDVEVPSRTADDFVGVVADIQRRTQPGEPIFVYPTSPLLYALAERPNPTRFDHLYPGAATSPEIDEVIADLDAANVRLVVISDFWLTAWGPPGPNAPLTAWLDRRFTEVARYGAYRVLLPVL